MTKLALGILMLGMISASSQATLLTNGDFEVRQLNGKQWRVFSAIDGWTTTSGHGIEVQRNTVVKAQSGNQYIELDAHSRLGLGNSALTQGIETVAGQNYWLSFHYIPRTNQGNNDNGVAAYWDEFDGDYSSFDPSDAVLSIDNMKRRDMPSWTEHGVKLEATSDLMALSFGGTGKDNTVGGFIDNVSLTAIPSPGSLALLTLSMAGLILARKMV